MNYWSKLSMKDRADVMKLFLDKGISDLDTIRREYNTFAGGGKKEERPSIIPFKQKNEVIITPDSEYNRYLNTLPDNQRFTPNDKYDSYLYWKLNGKPKNFKEAYDKDMFTYDSSDKSYHANSIAWDNDNDIGYFMKPKDHDTVKYELDWFNKGLVTEEGGWQRPETLAEWKESKDFRNNYELVDDPSRPNFFKYQPKKHGLGGNLFDDGGSYSYTKPLDNVFVDEYGNLLDLNVPSARGTVQLPDVIVTTRDPRKAVPTANSLNTSNIESTVKEAIKNYFVGNLSDDEVRRRLYHNLAPYGYTHTIARLESAIKNNTSHEFDRRHKNDRDRQDIWAEYLGIPEKERKALFDSSTSILRDSQYSPTVGKEQNIKYKAISNLSEADVRDLIQYAEVLPIGKNKVVTGGIGHALGRYTIGHNYDNKGEYVSYYDKWDLNPFSNAGEDLSLGIGKPVNIYDRIYLDDYYGTPEEYRGFTYIPELTVTANEYAKGGGIHIKPSHRGRLTELKKRTGKSEAELYKTGGPAVRKMITFARNARKWKHELGGLLEI